MFSDSCAEESAHFGHAQKDCSLPGGLGAIEVSQAATIPLQGIGADPRRKRTDLQLILRALNNGWEVPDQNRPAIVAFVLGVVEEQNISPRTRMRAVMALLKMDKATLAASYEALGYVGTGPKTPFGRKAALRALERGRETIERERGRKLT